jgi:hypothetical protein
MKYLTVCAAALLAIGLAASVTPASAGDYGGGGGGHRYRDGYQNDCYKCPKPRPYYDTTEVVKKSRDIDHSRVIETQSVVPSKRLIETNHLIIHENETRNVGTIEHNHTIIEKELVLTKRNVDHKYVNTEVNLVENKYHTERKHVVEEKEIPGEVRHLRCQCDERRHPVRAYGMATRVSAYARSPRYVRSRY